MVEENAVGLEQPCRLCGTQSKGIRRFNDRGEVTGITYTCPKESCRSSWTDRFIPVSPTSVLSADKHVGHDYKVAVNGRVWCKTCRAARKLAPDEPGEGAEAVSDGHPKRVAVMESMMLVRIRESMEKLRQERDSLDEEVKSFERVLAYYAKV